MAVLVRQNGTLPFGGANLVRLYDSDLSRDLVLAELQEPDLSRDLMLAEL